MVNVLDIPGALKDGSVLVREKLQDALDDPTVTELRFPPGEYRFDSSHEGFGNDRPYLWIRRSDVHLDLGQAVLRIEPEWPTATPTKTHSSERPPKPLWKAASASVVLIGTPSERQISNISIAGGRIAGYGEKVEWKPRSQLEEGSPDSSSPGEAEHSGGLAKLSPHHLGRRADVVGVRVGHSIVKGLRIEGLEVSDVYDGVQLVLAHDVEVTGCRFTRCHRQAVSITGTTKARISRCSADQCGEPFAKGSDWLGFLPGDKWRLGAYHLEPGSGELAGALEFESNTATACQIGFALKQGQSPKPVEEISITSCRVFNGESVGIFLENVRNWSISDCEVNHCTTGIAVTNKCTGPEGSLGVLSRNRCLSSNGIHHTNGYGIAVISHNADESLKQRGTQIESLHVQVIHNSCIGSASSGILLSEAQDIVCGFNNCWSNGRHGIEVNQTQASGPSSNLVLRANTCYANGGNGIDGSALRHAWLSENIASCSLGNKGSNDTGHGIFIDRGESIWLATNETSCNGSHGVHLRSISLCWLTECTSSNNSGHGIWLKSCSDATLSGYVVAGNGKKPDVKQS